MIACTINTTQRWVWIRGHVEDKRLCGALTALLRGYAALSTHVWLVPGESALALDPDYPEDFDAMVYGVEALLSKASAALVSYDTDPLRQLPRSS